MDPRSVYPGHFSDLVAIPSTSRNTKRHVILLDNRDRTSGTEFNFRAGINTWLENITEVRLLAACVPKVKDEMYVILSIPEFSNDDLLTSSSKQRRDVFAVLFFDATTLATGAVKTVKGSDFGGWVSTMRPPIPRIERMTIVLTKPDGTPVLPADTAGANAVSLMLEVTTESRSA